MDNPLKAQFSSQASPFSLKNEESSSHFAPISEFYTKQESTNLLLNKRAVFEQYTLNSVTIKNLEDKGKLFILRAELTSAGKDRRGDQKRASQYLYNKYTFSDYNI